MSWDVFVQDIPQSIRSVDEIPSNFQPASIGRRTELISRILEVVPFADFSDPTWGRIDSTAFSIEVNIGEKDPVCSFTFHARGDEMAAEVIAEILLHLGLRAFDPQAPSGLFELEFDPAVGLRKWRAYRDSIMCQR
jgi:hypothetical protein